LCWCVDTNLTSVTMKMFSHLICFIKKFYKCCTFNVISKDNATIHYITIQHRKFNSGPYRILVGFPLRKDPTGRLKKKGDNIKLDLRGKRLQGWEVDQTSSASCSVLPNLQVLLHSEIWFKFSVLRLFENRSANFERF
jgi:hypothetical protein